MKLSKGSLIAVLSFLCLFSLAQSQDAKAGYVWGSVQGVDGEPIPDARVVAFTPEGFRPVKHVITNQHGEFEMELPPERFKFRADAEGFEQQWFDHKPNYEEADVVEVPENGGVDIGFLLTAGNPPETGGIAGFVHGEEPPFRDEFPIAGAVVGVFHPNHHHPFRVVESRENGSYLFEGLPVGQYLLMARAEGFYPQWFPLVPHREQAEPVPVFADEITDDINFLLERHQGGEPGIVSGVVRSAGEGDRPLPGAVVLAFFPESDEPAAETRSGEGGHYRFEELETGEYQFMSFAEGHEHQWFDHVPEREQAEIIPVHPEHPVTDINFDLPRMEQPETGFVGVVVEQRDEPRPIPRAMVQAFEPDNPHPIAHAITNEHGEFFVHVPHGEYIAVARAPRFAPEWYEEKPVREEANIFVVEGEEPTEHIDFTLEHHEPPSGLIYGATFNEINGEPLPEVRVTARMIEPEHFQAHAFSNREGHYEIMGLPPGLYTVFGEKPGYYPALFPDTILVEEGEVGPIDLVLEPIVTGYLSGHVYNAEDNSPIWHGRVMAINIVDPHIHQVTETHRDGYYIFDALPEGFYHVRAVAHGFLSEVYPDSVGVFADSPAEGIDFYLTPVEMGSIAGMVTDAEANEPIEDAAICAHHLGPPPFEEFTRSIEDGSYIFEELIPGYYRLAAVAEGYHPLPYADSVFLENGGSLEDINFALMPREGGDGIITGRVVDEEQGNPIFSRVIAFGSRENDPRPVIRVFTFTNDDGYYSFERLPSDLVYRVRADARMYIGEFYDDARNWQDAELITPDAQGIDFALTHRAPGYFAISGVVKKDGEAVPGAVLYATDDEGNTCITASDIDGYYSFFDMNPGQYELTAIDFEEQAGYPGGIELTFTDYDNADIDLASTGISDTETALPKTTALIGNYPNPFNPQTTITFDLSANSQVNIGVYNIKGQLVKQLVDGQFTAGRHSVVWNGEDQNGNSVSAGIYFYNFQGDGKTSVGKMALIK